MNKRERLLKTMNGESTDRVPVSPFIWSNYVNAYYDRVIEDDKLDEMCLKIYLDFDFDVMLRTCNISAATDETGYDCKNWSVDVSEKRVSDRDRHVITTVRTPEREMMQIKRFQQVTPFEEVSANVKFFIEQEEDFDQFEKYRPQPTFDCTRIQTAKKMVANNGLVAPWTQGVFNRCTEFRKLDDLVLDMIVNPTFYQRMMNFFMNRWCDISVQMAQAGADCLCISGNIATGTLVGRNYFDQMVAPYEKKHIKRMQAAGALALYHNCGDANALLPSYNQLGLDLYESLVEPPYGDTDLDYAIKTLDRNLTLIGNIDQISFLMKADSQQVKNACKRLLDHFKERGRFILATTDYLSEQTPAENLKAMRASVD